MNKGVKTTVIGSYPVITDNMEFMNGYFNQKDSFSWEPHIKSAVSDMVDAGIDIISDGQTRDPFVNIFFRKIKGCRIRDRPEVVDKVEFDGSITVDDQKYVRSIIPKNTKIIGLIAGPYTLAQSCVDLHYNDEKELAFDFAHALRKEAKMLEGHVSMISVDEPFFSVDMPEYAEELIQIVVEDLSCPTRLHACGDVSKIVPDLIELPIDILSHEFKATPQLFNAFKEHSFSQSICLGSVRSDNPRVEPVEEIIEHINHGIDIFGDSISQLSPDCGLRLQTRDVAFQKLKYLVKACEEVYGR